MSPACVADYRELARRRLPAHLLRIHRRRLLRRGDAGPQRRRHGGDRAAPAGDARHVQARHGDRRCGQTLVHAGGPAPVGMAGMYARRGEAQAARAAAAAGRAVLPLDRRRLRARGGGRRPAAAALVPALHAQGPRLHARAAGAGEGAGLPGAGVHRRPADAGLRATATSAPASPAAAGSGRAEHRLDGLTHPAWMWDVWANGRPHTLGSVAGAVQGGKTGSPTSWPGSPATSTARSPGRTSTGCARLGRARSSSRACWTSTTRATAVKAGAQGLVVSNHGGRQLDGVRSSISALPAIAEAVGGDLESTWTAASARASTC